MKNQIISWIGSALLLIGFAMLFTQCEEPEQMTPSTTDDALLTDRDGLADPTDVCSCLDANFALEDLSDEEAAALTFMREEEKLARDVYLNLYEKWGARVFTNISRSEQRHMDAVLCLLNRYGLDDVVGENPVGVFQNTDLQELYNALMEQGLESLEAALTVGATIEDVDILDLQENIENPAIDNEDIIAVFNNLTKGSRNHMRAFTKNLNNLGTTYDVQYLGQEEYEAIIGSDWERGEGLCGTCLNDGSGNGAGPGLGNGTGTCDGSGPGNGTGPGFGNGTGTCDGTGPGN